MPQRNNNDPVLGAIQGGPSHRERLEQSSTRHNPFRTVLERGVYDTPFLSEGGDSMMVAISHDGRRIAEAAIVDGRSRQSIHDQLKAQLDQADPVIARISPSLIS